MGGPQHRGGGAVIINSASIPALGMTTIPFICQGAPIRMPSQHQPQHPLRQRYELLGSGGVALLALHCLNQRLLLIDALLRFCDVPIRFDQT
jgi:hypothetical protein